MTHPQKIADRFEIGALIGRGGMGDVYRGTDLLTGQPVAVKFLKPEIVSENPELVARFEREGEALRALNHPNIVKMLASVEDDGHRCLVMEYVGGGSLRDLLAQQSRLPVDRVLFIALDLADALTRAHRLKIVHRDIKPANVLLAEDGTPRLSDFGVAHLSDRTRVTETGSLVGTYAYLSPEACRGEELDARTDIWSFGVLLFELLAGQRPFEGSQPAVILTAILTKPVPDLAALRPDAPPALVSLIHAMLDKDRDQRINSVRLVGAQLEAIISGASTPTPRTISSFAATPLMPTPPADIPATPVNIATPPIQRTPPHRSRGRWAAAAIALLALVVAGALLVLPGLAPAPAVITVEPALPGEYLVLVADFEAQGGASLDVARFITRDLRRKLEDEVPFSQVRVRDYPRVLRTEDEARAAADANRAMAVVWGSYTPDLIEAEVQLGATAGFPAIQFERQMLERTANVTLRLTDPRTESLVNPVLAALAVLHLADGSGYEALRTLAVLDQIGAATPTIDGAGISARFNRFIERYVADTPAALDEINAALTLDPANALLYASRAAIRQRAGQLDESRQDIRSAERSGPAGWALPLYLEANIPYLRNDPDAALPLYDRLIELRPDDWFFYSMRGGFYYLKDDLARAKADYDRAIALQPNASFPYVISSMIALREGRMADAHRHMDTILHQFSDPLFASRIARVAFGDQRGSPFGSIYAAVGYLILDQYDQLLDAALDAVAIDGQLSDLYAIAGYAYCNLGRYEEAEAAYTRGIEMKPNTPIGYALRAEIRLKRLNVLGANADAARARALIRETGQAQELNAYITAGLLLQVGCTNFWDWQPPDSTPSPGD